MLCDQEHAQSQHSTAASNVQIALMYQEEPTVGIVSVILQKNLSKKLVSAKVETQILQMLLSSSGGQYCSKALLQVGYCSVVL